MSLTVKPCAQINQQLSFFLLFLPYTTVWLYADKKSLCDRRWGAVEGNWLLLTRGCQNGDGSAVHFQFRPRRLESATGALQCLKHHFLNPWCGKHDLIPVQCFSSDSPSLQIVFQWHHFEGVIVQHCGWRSAGSCSTAKEVKLLPGSWRPGKIKIKMEVFTLSKIPNCVLNCWCFFLVEVTLWL